MMLKNDYSHQCVAAKLDGKWQFINKRGTGYSFRHPVSGKWLDEDSLMTSVKERKEKTAKISPRYQGWVDLGDRFFEVIDRNDWLASEAEYKRLVSIYQKDPFFWWLCGAHFLMDCLDAGQYDMFLRNAQEALKTCNHAYVLKDIKYLISEAKQDRRLSEDASKKSSFGIK